MRNEKFLLFLFLFLSSFSFLNPFKKFLNSIFLDHIYSPVIFLKEKIDEFKNWKFEKKIILENLKEKNRSDFYTTYKIYYEPVFPPYFITLYNPENLNSNIEFVLQGENFVGIIKENKKDKIVIETIFSPNFKIDVMDKRSKIFGVLKSKGEFFLNLYYIPYWADIQAGDTLVTGGIGKFPYSGIPIGIIQKIEKKEGETFLEIKVKPLFDPSKFSIFILK
jgi:hypothetical protein